MREVFLEPFYEYVDEHLDGQRAMLALLLRYKQRSEWFHRDRLWRLTQDDKRNAERLLALDLYLISTIKALTLRSNHLR